MLTVIFFQKSSQPFIDRYKTLFQPYIDDGKIDFCFWDEDGREPKDAIKELSGIVRGIREWRALIVLPPDDDAIKDDNPYLRTRDENPFDYLCNGGKDPQVKESDIPLIRLAQMLGGVPLVNHNYVIDETGKPVIAENRDLLEEYQKIWNELDSKYSLSYDAPKELYLFSARYSKKIIIPSASDDELLKRHETDSSLFWYRNRYPAMARFLIQDCAAPGHAHFSEDVFGFWMTALTIALNSFSTGSLEAYRLYSVKSVISRDEIHQLFSDYYHRLNSIRFAAEKQVIELRKQMQMKRESDALPDYKYEIPVWFKAIEEENLHIPSRDIGLSGDCPRKEEPWWNAKTAESMKNLDKVFRNLQIELDRASVLTKLSSDLEDSEIVELDEYQVSEMTEQLNELEKEILTFNTNAVLPKLKYKKDLAAAKQDTARCMRKRMTRKLTVTAGLSGIGIFLVSYLPDVVYQATVGGNALSMLGMILVGGIIMGIALIGVLLDSRSGIISKIFDYNDVMRSILDDIKGASDTFSRYLGKCCTYMRGLSLLQVLNQRTIRSTEGILTMTRHINQLSAKINMIEDWLKDFEMTPKPDDGSFFRVVFDYEIDPQRNNGYLIDTDAFNPDIPGPNGCILQAPYPYVTELQIERIPLFEENT